jgi:hypothetical protein
MRPKNKPLLKLAKTTDMSGGLKDKETLDAKIQKAINKGTITPIMKR